MHRMLSFFLLLLFVNGQLVAGAELSGLLGRSKATVAGVLKDGLLPLYGEMTNEDPEVRQAAFESISVLVAMLHEKNRTDLVALLIENELVPRLLTALTDTDESIRHKALHILFHLASCRGSDSAAVRSTMLGEENIWPALLDLLERSGIDEGGLFGEDSLLVLRLLHRFTEERTNVDLENRGFLVRSDSVAPFLFRFLNHVNRDRQDGEGEKDEAEDLGTERAIGLALSTLENLVNGGGMVGLDCIARLIHSGLIHELLVVLRDGRSSYRWTALKILRYLLDSFGPQTATALLTAEEALEVLDLALRDDEAIIREAACQMMTRNFRPNTVIAAGAGHRHMAELLAGRFIRDFLMLLSDEDDERSTRAVVAMLALFHAPAEDVEEKISEVDGNYLLIQEVHLAVRFGRSPLGYDPLLILEGLAFGSEVARRVRTLLLEEDPELLEILEDLELAALLEADGEGVEEDDSEVDPADILAGGQEVFEALPGPALAVEVLRRDPCMDSLRRVSGV